MKLKMLLMVSCLLSASSFAKDCSDLRKKFEDLDKTQTSNKAYFDEEKERILNLRDQAEHQGDMQEQEYQRWRQCRSHSDAMMCQMWKNEALKYQKNRKRLEREYKSEAKIHNKWVRSTYNKTVHKRNRARDALNSCERG